MIVLCSGSLLMLIKAKCWLVCQLMCCWNFFHIQWMINKNMRWSKVSLGLLPPSHSPVSFPPQCVLPIQLSQVFQVRFLNNQANTSLIHFYKWTIDKDMLYVMMCQVHIKICIFRRVFTFYWLVIMTFMTFTGSVRNFILRLFKTPYAVYIFPKYRFDWIDLD